VKGGKGRGEGRGKRHTFANGKEQRQIPIKWFSGVCKVIKLNLNSAGKRFYEVGDLPF
jgi:hypothetical protein